MEKQIMIGELLAETRKDHGDKQTDLAQKLNVSIATVRSWEQEKSLPPNEMLVAICRLYHVSADYLLGLSNVDPVYIQRRRLNRFSEAELEEMQLFEEYLIWKKAKAQK